MKPVFQRKWLVSVFIGAMIAIAGCTYHNEDYDPRNPPPSLAEIERDLPPGTSKEAVAAYLHGRGVGYTYLAPSNTILAGLPGKPQFVTEFTQIQFHLDAEGKLASLETKKYYTGP